MKNLWLSLDPYMRGRMSQAKSYAKGVEIGEVMTGETAGEVVESKHPKFKPGDKVHRAAPGWQLYWLRQGRNADQGGRVEGARCRTSSAASACRVAPPSSA